MSNQVLPDEDENRSRRWMLRAGLSAFSATVASVALSRRAAAQKPSACVPAQCAPGTCEPVNCLPVAGCSPPGQNKRGMPPPSRP